MSADLPHRVVSREEWLAARRAHLKTEKALTRLRDLVTAERRTLPWVRVDKAYVFDSDEGPRQLPHLYRKDVRIVAVSRAPQAKLRAYRERMGWQFEWVSSNGNDFNYDFGVSFLPSVIERGSVDYNFSTITVDPRYVNEELPGISVFYKDAAGHVYHTYSTYARGLDDLLGANHYLDLTPTGRNEAAFPDWPRRRDEYPND
jgi:predicted dithiol-disulfide oxidoreductase (DUF899 family)